jgi:hypothetical protein
MLNTPGHKGNANQNDPKISPLSIQNGYHENTNTIKCWQRWGKNKLLYTVGGNVN